MMGKGERDRDEIKEENVHDAPHNTCFTKKKCFIAD
jgi:hypothetical protein